MPITIEAAALNMALALFCGALIGSERQVRQRMAGLRTNAMVALGAAGFVVFSVPYPDEVSPTRVAAQVVSGIGFLGGAIIFRHGFTVHGLNTAATLWCSAAEGIMAWGVAVVFALLLTGLIVFVNLGLRPLVKLLKSKTGAGMPLQQDYRLEIRMKRRDRQQLGAVIMKRLSVPGFTVSEAESVDADDEENITLCLSVAVEDRDDTLLKSAIAPLMIDPKIQPVRWEPAPEV